MNEINNTYNNNNNNDEDMKIDYNSYLIKISYSLYNSIRNLKICLEWAMNNHNNNNLLLKEMESERNEKLMYSILEDLETICSDINNTNFIPNYNVRLLVTPKYIKEDLR